MGLDYEYQLRFQRDDLGSVLHALNEIADVAARWEYRVRAPGRLNPVLQEGGWDRLGDKGFDWESAELTLTMRFRIDRVLNRYVKARATETGFDFPTDESGRVAIGCVYVHLFHEASDTVSLDFCPATTSMSLLFAASDSIRQTFVDFLKAKGGIDGFFCDSDCNWGPVRISETLPDYNPRNLFTLHQEMSPCNEYYRVYDKVFADWMAEEDDA